MLSNLIIAASFVVFSAVQPVVSEPISLPGPRLSFLSKRQADGGIDPNGIPTQCITPCQPIVEAVSNATCNNDVTSCLCTNTLATAFKACLDCAVTNDPADVSQDLEDADIQALNEACSTAGTPITIGGNSPSSTLTIVASGASSTSSSAATSTGPAQVGGGSTEGTTTPAAGSASTTTPAPLPGVGAGGSGGSTDTTSAPGTTTTTTNSSAMGLRASVSGAVFAALLAGASFAMAV